MPKNLVVVLFFLTFFPLCMYGTIIRVPSQTPSIQTAINFTVDGDTVLVDTGRYVENINFLGKKIIVASNYLLDPNPAYIVKTIIDGSAPANANRASVVLFITGEDSTSVLEGFTLTGGTGTLWQDHHNFIYYREGGGILTDYTSPTIRNNLIINNTANNRAGVSSAGGGGIRCSDGNPRILNNIIMQNDGRYGGGVVLNYTGAIIKNNVIVKNTGGQDYGGSGVWSYANGPAPKIVENNTIAENSSALDGGGVSIGSTSMTLRNNIIWGNTASTSPQISISAGGAAVSYCDVQGGYIGAGDINADPLFTDTSYYFYAGSPCKDAGDPNPLYNDVEDPANPGYALFPSMGTLRNDMGAYGGGGALMNIAFTLHKGAPRVPKALSAYSDYLTPAKIMLSWIDPDSTVGGSRLTNFKIRIYRDAAFLADVDSGEQAYVDSNLTLHQKYTYYFRAITSTDSSSLNSASAYAGGSGVPNPPTSIAETDSVAGITLWWKNPSRQTDNTPLNDMAFIYIYREGIVLDSIAQSSPDTGQFRSYFDSTQGYHYYRLFTKNGDAPAQFSAPSDSILGCAGLIKGLHYDFENGAGPVYRTGTWDTTSSIADSGLSCITDSPHGNYAPSSNTYFMTPAILLNPDYEMRFNDIAIVRPGNYCIVEISTNHRKSFTTLKAYNWNAQPQWQDGTADPADWVQERLDLSAYAGDTVAFRFRLMTGSGITADGWYIDNLNVAPIPPVTLPLSVQKKWNMVSLSVKKYDHSLASVFPGAISKAFIYDSGYARTDSIYNGAGCWVKFSDTATIPVTGLAIKSDTFAVVKGWNMIGSMTDTIDAALITSSPSGIVQAGYFIYDGGGYAPSPFIEPGRAYWVKVSRTGVLYLSHALKKR
ncbi:MAG: hypothetical protein ACHQQQ_03600 [Bacteroidota bacterium]